MILKYKQKLNLFPIPLYTGFINDKSMCNTYCELLLKQRDQQLGSHRINSWKSEDNLMDDKNFEDLVSMINVEMESIFDDYRVIRDKIYINNMWAQISNNNDYHEQHIHPNSYFSGILYLRCPESSGETILHNPLIPLINPPKDEATLHNCTAWSITPQTGKLIVFPSWLRHSVRQSENQYDDRITLAFTVMFSGDSVIHTEKVTYK